MSIVRDLAALRTLADGEERLLCVYLGAFHRPTGCWQCDSSGQSQRRLMKAKAGDDMAEWKLEFLCNRTFSTLCRLNIPLQQKDNRREASMLSFSDYGKHFQS